MSDQMKVGERVLERLEGDELQKVLNEVCVSVSRGRSRVALAASSGGPTLVAGSPASFSVQGSQVGNAVITIVLNQETLRGLRDACDGFLCAP